MNCRQYSKYIGDYVNRTLGSDIAQDVEMHLAACAKCASLAGDLEQTSLMVRSLEREVTPVGFEERLKARLAAQRAVDVRQSVLSRWVDAVRDAFAGNPVYGRRPILRPALAGLLVLIVLAGSVFMLMRGYYGESETDWSYIHTCRRQHSSFAAANPLADESAVILRERVSDLAQSL
jgi:anti-sigma factor RsiW